MSLSVFKIYWLNKHIVLSSSSVIICSFFVRFDNSSREKIHRRSSYLYTYPFKTQHGKIQCIYTELFLIQEVREMRYISMKNAPSWEKANNTCIILNSTTDVAKIKETPQFIILRYTLLFHNGLWKAIHIILFVFKIMSSIWRFYVFHPV